MDLWLLLAEINSAFYRLQVWMVAKEVSTVVMCNVRVTPRTIDPVHTNIRHYLVSVTRYEVSRSTSELIIPRYLRYRLSATNSHFYFS
jgi:hypothetical protein